MFHSVPVHTAAPGLVSWSLNLSLEEEAAEEGRCSSYRRTDHSRAAGFVADWHWTQIRSKPSHPPRTQSAVDRSRDMKSTAVAAAANTGVAGCSCWSMLRGSGRGRPWRVSKSGGRGVSKSTRVFEGRGAMKVLCPGVEVRTDR